MPNQSLKKIKDEIKSFFIENPDQTYTTKQLLEIFKVTKEDSIFFEFLLDDLADQNQISKIGKTNYKGKIEIKKSKVLTGTFDLVNPKFGFVRYSPDNSDIYIESKNFGGAWDGDTVEVEITGKSNRKNENPEGRIIGIVKRGKNTLVGKIKTFGNYALVNPDQKNIQSEIFIAKGDFMDAKKNDLVIVQIDEYPTSNTQAKGHVIEVLGPAGDNNAEMHAILAEFGLPNKFPDIVEKEAEKISEIISQEEIAKRKDCREMLTFTIDPFDAKDFDDAISFRQLENGNFEVGVHIADVSYYVRENTEIQKEAYLRATSVYLVDRTIPMLPEKLSNGLCSLRPNEDKLAFSVIFELDMGGKVIKEWFGRTVINSKRRFTYEEAQEILELKTENFSKKEIEDFQNPLKILNGIAKTLRSRRFKNGAFNFESNELKFTLDKDGRPLGVSPKIRKDAHKLVEEFMLLANKRVAEFVYYERFKREKMNQDPEDSPTMVYRIHEPPNPEKVEILATFAAKLGYKIDTKNQESLSSSLNKMVDEVNGKPIQNMLESLAVRTMSKARYSVTPLGHFGLAFAHYSHFTSPIRRYPDLMAHRLLEHYLKGGKSVLPEPVEESCVHSSEREKVAAEAERASVKYKQVEYMSYQDKNVPYDGVITGITDFGIFIEIEGTACEGMARLADLTDDYYIYDPDNFRVTGKSSGRVIAFGDEVKVKIKSTDLERRSMDLSLLEVKGQKIIKKHKVKVGGRKKEKKKKRKN